MKKKNFLNIEIDCNKKENLVYKNICFSYYEVGYETGLKTFCSRKNLTTTDFPILDKRFILDYLTFLYYLQISYFFNILKIQVEFSFKKKTTFLLKFFRRLLF